MTRTEFEASLDRARARETAQVPTGRSYHVQAPSRDLAPGAGRLAAAREGQRNAMRTRVLHVELVEPGTYEVVLAE